MVGTFKHISFAGCSENSKLFFGIAPSVFFWDFYKSTSQIGSWFWPLEFISGSLPEVFSVFFFSKFLSGILPEFLSGFLLSVSWASFQSIIWYSVGVSSAISSRMFPVAPSGISFWDHPGIPHSVPSAIYRITSQGFPKSYSGDWSLSFCRDFSRSSSRDFGFTFRISSRNSL